ncbi:MAG TPA: heme-binding protein [Caulobacteraceae bacterium]
MSSKRLAPKITIARTLCGATLALAGVAWTCVASAAESEPAGPLPARLAIRAAAAALAKCDADGLHVSVSIVDREGVTRVLLVDDGAGPVSITTSRRKAYTSAAFGISTGDLARMPPPPSNGPPLVIDPEILPLAGGLPIRRGDAVIAAIGVGGADRSDKDEACAQAGLDSIRDQLK